MKIYGFGFLSEMGTNVYYCGEKMIKPFSPFINTTTFIPSYVSPDINEARFDFETYQEADTAATKMLPVLNFSPMSVIIVEKDTKTGIIKRYRPTIFDF